MRITSLGLRIPPVVRDADVYRERHVEGDGAFHPLANQRRSALGLFAPNLPWLDAGSVADELAIYDALCQVERWAQRASS